MQIDVHLLPRLVSPQALAGSTVVVIDVLRATTTIVTALAAGALEVIPCGLVDEARRRAAAIGAQALLGGERHGVRQEGFALGNSPLEYTRELVAGRTIVMTTTNGTQAMGICHEAADVQLASFTNLAAVCGALLHRDRVHILCAGTDGDITREDALLAGAIVEELSQDNPSVEMGNDETLLCRAAWQCWAQSGGSLEKALLASRGGRNLQNLGMQADVRFAAQLNLHKLVPRLDTQTGSIRAP